MLCVQSNPRAAASRPSGSTCICHADSEDDSKRALTGDDAVDDSAWALPNLSGSDADWRDFRAQLVARSRDADSGAASSTAKDTPDGAALWAHELPGPEQGCVLLANPLLFKTSQTYFRRSVILITDHDEGYSRGIVMNKAVGKTLAEAEDLSLEGSGYECFAECPLNLGGDVPHDGLVMLHPHDVKGARRLRRGIYEGGGEAVVKLVKSGDAAPTSTRWFYRYAGWGPGQLANEITHQHSWYCVSCSPELLMAEAKKEDPDAMWHAVMQLLDDDHRRVSDQVRADAKYE